MVSFKVDAEATAKVQGADNQEKYPIVAKIKGTGKDGGLSVQVSGEGTDHISARISGDNNNPIVVGPISVVPDLKMVKESIDIGGLVSSIAKMAGGIEVRISDKSSPIAVALGKIPVDLTVSVYSPAQEQVFKVEIKGSIGEKSAE